MLKILLSFLLLAFASPVQAANQKFIAGSGVGLTWTPICSTEINGLVAGNAVQCTVVVTNGTALDLFADFSESVTIATSVSTAGAPYVGISIYPLNQDGTTYGDGLFAASAAGPPNVITCAIPSPPSVAGPFLGTGSCRQIPLPPGSFIIVVYNGLGQNFGAGSNTIKYRTYNYQSN